MNLRKVIKLIKGQVHRQFLPIIFVFKKPNSKRDREMSVIHLPTCYKNLRALYFLHIQAHNLPVEGTRKSGSMTRPPCILIDISLRTVGVNIVEAKVEKVI